MTPDDARREAERRFGDVARYRTTLRRGERRRRMGGMRMNVVNEVRLAARALVRRPGFTTVAVLTLALGIGANVAIFAVVYSVLLRPLSYPGSDRIVVITHHAPGLGIGELTNSAGTMRFYRQEASFLSGLGGYEISPANLTGLTRPVRIQVAQITPNLLQVLETPPAIGRPFNAADAAKGAAPVAILTHGTWVDRFGADPNVLGRTVELDGKSTQIVGVMPEGFAFPDPSVGLLRPLYIAPNGQFGAFGIRGVARLAPDVSLPEAQQRIQDLQPRMVPFFGDKQVTPAFLKKAGWSVTLEPLRKQIVGDVASALWIILGTVGFVLLIASANVANLFLVRAESRRTELAVRVAMGAGRGRIASVFLSESLVLGVAGGVLGLVLAWGGVKLLVAFGPQTLPRLHEIRVGPPVLGFTAGLSVASALAFGGIPLLRVFGRSFARGLRDGGRGSTDGRERHRARNVLVTGQLALALVLLVGAGLMVHTFRNLRSVDLGFDPKDVLTVGLSMGGAGAVRSHLPEAARFYQQVADQVASLPAVEHVGVTNAVPLGGGDWNGSSLQIESKAIADDALPPFSMYKAIGPGYFEAMDMTLLAGRTERPSDWEDGVPVAWVNETFARTFLDGKAVGKRIRYSNGTDSTWAEVVGVVKDAHELSLTQPMRAIAYLPLLTGQWGFPDLDVGYLVVKVARRPLALVPRIREIIHQANPDVPITTISTMGEVVSRSMQRTSFTLVLLGIATLIALFLGAIGLFGVVSYVVSQRAREIGIRMAMGAREEDVRRMVLREGGALGLVGTTVGLVGAFALTRLMHSVLFAVSTVDPVTFVVAPFTLLAVVVLATWLPARRASRVDPVEALRAE